ncbi:hypothetical protein CCZ28_15640 [Pseudomonas oryzihabitans]|nr:hypothetical protein CCZ28_15640 [Pseudomonas psychrotolerans]
MLMNKRVLLVFFLFFIFASLAVWLFLFKSSIFHLFVSEQPFALLCIVALYFSSHSVRMLRLSLLTLDEREKALSLMGAHALTAFPSAFLPFKIGEFLRLGGFFYVYSGRRKALAIWLAERFSDIVVLVLCIVGFYIFNVEVPAEMRAVFMVFLSACLLGLFGMFAVSKVFVYLNRHLVLVSHSSRGLSLLKVSHGLRLLEADVVKSVEGRLSGILLLTILVWALEMLAIAVFVKVIEANEPSMASLFYSILLGGLTDGSNTQLNVFGLHQSLALALLASVFLVLAGTATLLKESRSQDAR